MDKNTTVMKADIEKVLSELSAKRQKEKDVDQIDMIDNAIASLQDALAYILKLK